MNASADGQGQVFQAGRDIVISGQPHANARKLTVLNVAAAAQVLTEMAASDETRDEAVVIVADMEPEVARLRLEAMPPESAGQILARMDHRLAYERLARIPDTKAAAILRHMPAEPAAELAAKYSQESIILLLSEMGPRPAARILTQLPLTVAATLAWTLPKRGTEDRYSAALFAAIPVARLAYLLSELPHLDAVLELMEFMSVETVQGLLSIIQPSSSATLLTKMPVGRAARVLAWSEVSVLKGWLGAMSDDVLVERSSDLLAEVGYIDLTLLLLQMPSRRACHLVAGLSSERVAPAIAKLPEGRAAVLLALVTEEHAGSIMKQLPENMRRSLKAYLA